jgi:hypothetical protein
MSKSEWDLGWNDEKKVAAIYYCYLSLDKTDRKEKNKQFAALFDKKQNLDWYLAMMGSKAHDAKMPYSLAFDDFSNAKDEIVKYCDEVISKFSEDERYECIVEEMDRISADSNSGFLSFNSRKFLWGFVLYSVSTGILAGEKVKYLNHLCRISRE